MKPCTIPGCPNPHKAKGLCAVHYSDKRRRDEGRSVRVTYEHCTVPGCDRPHIAKGMCALHRQRQRTGTDRPGSPATTARSAGLWILVRRLCGWRPRIPWGKSQ